MRLPFFQVPPTEFIHFLRYQIQWPKLAVMRMTRQLQIRSDAYRLIEFERLMVHENDRFRWIDPFDKFANAHPVLSGRTILSSDNGHAGNIDPFITQFTNTMLGDIFYCRTDAADIFMISCNTENSVF